MSAHTTLFSRNNNLTLLFPQLHTFTIPLNISPIFPAIFEPIFYSSKHIPHFPCNLPLGNPGETTAVFACEMSCFSCFSSNERKASKRFDYDPPVPAPVSAPTPTVFSNRNSDAVKRPEYTKAENLSPEERRTENPKERSPTEATPNNETGDGNIAAQTFTFRELASATKNFRTECLLGEGGFGRVYKGFLESTGQTAAVKQLDRNGFQGNKEFLVEVLMLSLLHHENLVNLIGYCADGEQRLLVYEYMPLGSLEDHLFEIAPDQKPLSWHSRMKIAYGAAKGLEYLHDQSNPPVIYRDLKSSNILLDEEYNPKLSDFGLAKLGPVGENLHVSSRVMGTYGYCAPEYVRTGQLTVKSDVYSFGVVLLELITGKRVIDTTRETYEQNLVTWAQPLFKDQKRFVELADPLLHEDCPERGLNQAVAVAAMCLQEEPSVRPLMADVVTALSYLTRASVSPAGSSGHPSFPLHEDRTLDNDEKLDEESAADRQRAVAEAIEWGSNSRNSHRSQIEVGSL